MSSGPRAARYAKLHRSGYRIMVDATVTRRKAQALAAIGYTMNDLGPVLNIGERRNVSRFVSGKKAEKIHRQVEKSMAEYYAAHAMEPRSTPGAKRAIASARKRGYMPPLAWDDIENDEVPAVRMPGMCGKNRHPESQMRERTHEDGATRKYCPACKSEWAVEKKRAKEMAQ